MSRPLSLDLFTESLASTQAYRRQTGESEGQRQRLMIAAVKKAMETELTQRQKECIQLYYFDQKTMKEIGLLLGIGEPCVSRHLKRARHRLATVLHYFFLYSA